MEPAGDQVCPHCAALMAEGSPHCTARACAYAHAQAEARGFYKQDWNTLVQHQHDGVRRAGGAVLTAAQRLGLAPEQMIAGVVPRQERPVVALPDERRAAYVAHLEWVVEQSFTLGAPAPAQARRPQIDVDEAPLTGMACAACQGFCCTLGGETHAFQTRETIDHFRRLNPDLGAEEIVAHYLAQIPESSVEHSCVFHGPLGCVLPRPERAEICNVHQCSMKRLFKQQLDQTGVDRTAWIGHSPDGGIGIGIVDADGAYQPVTDRGDADEAALETARNAILKHLPQKMPGI